jgi:hypothetical protein
MNILLGCILLATPFLIFTLFMIKDIGLILSLKVWGICIGITVCLVSGVLLITGGII